jgi:hypothetical protein
MAVNVKVKPGDVYGYLTVLEIVEIRPDFHVVVRCQCECGNVVNKTQQKLIAPAYPPGGRTTSCGCRKKGIEPKGRFRHGLYRHPLYQTWVGIKARTSDLTNPDYGGRGITFYDEWTNDPASFIEYVERVLGPKPDSRLPSGRFKYSIDRENNDGNYEPGNIRSVLLWDCRMAG